MNSDPINDPINPAHYKSHPSGIETIQITEWFSFNIGNAVKYLWRSGLKGSALQDLEKARWYIERELTRLEQVEQRNAAKADYALEVAKARALQDAVEAAGGNVVRLGVVDVRGDREES